MMATEYEREMVERIRDILIEQLDTVGVSVHGSAVDWMAQDMYDDLEDEFRGFR